MPVSRKMFETQVLELLAPLQGVARRLTSSAPRGSALRAARKLCLHEMVLEMQRQERSGSAARRLAMGTATGVLVLGTLYGLHLSVAGFLPG